VNEDEVRELLRAKIREAGSAQNLAKTIGVVPSYVSQVVNGTCRPGRKILAFLGLDREINYKRTQEPTA